MSSIGKIFVVVNLVLSLLLLGALGALLNASAETKETVTQLETEKGTLQRDLDQARSEFDARQRNLENDKRALQTAREDADVAREAAERASAKVEQDNQQLRSDLTKLTASYDLLQGDLSAKDQRNRELQGIADQSRQDALTAREAQRQAETGRRAAEDERAASQREIADLQAELTAALDEARQSAMLLEVAKSSGFDATAVMAMPAIEAIVAEVDNEFRFVILDKGRNDQVQRGFVFDVFSNDGYVGRVRVDEVHENYATASILLSKREMRRFDRATTRL